MNLNEFAQVKKNLKGKGFKKSRKPKAKDSKNKPCERCGSQVKSAIVTNMFFAGKFCNNCIKEMGQ